MLVHSIHQLGLFEDVSSAETLRELPPSQLISHYNFLRELKHRLCL